MAWQELLHLRLTGQHQRIIQEDSTDRAEELAGMQQSVYFYLGRCEPAYGDCAVAAERPLSPSIVATPFDTGGMMLRWIHTKPEKTDQQRSEMVESWTLDLSSYPAQFRSWGEQNFGHSAPYSNGARPARHLVAAIDLTNQLNTSRSWVWEGRVPARSHDCEGIEPIVLVMSSEQLRAYRTWLVDSLFMPVDGYREHVRMIKSIWIDPGLRGSAERFNAYLGGIRQW